METVWAWLKENKDRILTLVGVLLVGILCFEAGLIQGKIQQNKPIVLSLPASPALTLTPEESVPAVASKPSALGVEPVVQVFSEKKDCMFVGSKNSNKYHLPSCAVAKRIKAENKVCFSSKEDAEKRGYVPSCLK